MKFSTGPMKQLLSLSPLTLSPVYKSAWIYRVKVDAHLLPQCLLYRDVGFAHLRACSVASILANSL